MPSSPQRQNLKSPGRTRFRRPNWW